MQMRVGWLEVVGLASWVGAIALSAPAWADSSLTVVYPPLTHTTTANQIFLIGSAPVKGDVLVNGQAISRSSAGHFAPSFPLQVGENRFIVHYGTQEIKLTVTRTTTEPGPLTGLTFASGSLMPSVDIARQPGELICFSAIAPPTSSVSVKLADQTIPLSPQSQSVSLPDNSAVLTGQNQPMASRDAGRVQGCTSPVLVGNLGQPEFLLTQGDRTISQFGTGKIEILSPTQLEVAEVTAESGTARTGPSTDYSRLTPLPKGTQAVVTGREGDWLRLDYGAWIKRSETQVRTTSVPPRTVIRSVNARQVGEWTEVVFPVQVPVPVSVQQGDRSFTLTLYNTTAQTDTIYVSDDPLINRLDWQQVVPGQVQYTFQLKSAQQWGYKLRYDGTSLILSLRHPPAIAQPSSEGTGSKNNRRAAPLAGIKVLLDPGHGGPEDLGARGPTGYPEKDAALAIAKLVREQLLQRGATVYMTRDSDIDVSLQDRVAQIARLEPAVALSLHYNALPDNGDALHTQGVAAFWYNSQAHSLASFLHHYLVTQLHRPSYGVFWNNLALTRPTVAPSVLLELGFMINPVEFEWITNAQEQKKLAVAIAEGITAWVAQSR